MFPVSPAFRDQIRADNRRIVTRLTVDYTFPAIDPSIIATVSEQANVSYPAQTADAVLNPWAKYASLDGVWVLGQDFALAPTLGEAQFWQMGWWGNQLAGAGGNLTAPFPTLSVTFGARPVHSLHVMGDSRRQEWPVDFIIRIFDAASVLLHTFNVFGNASVDWSQSITPIVGVARMDLEIRRWSHAGRQVKILEFYTAIQETYREDEIMGVGLLEEREVTQGTLPVGVISANEITVRLNNFHRQFDAGNTQSPLFNLLRPNRRIRAWIGVRYGDGSEEFVPLGTFWSGDWTAPRDKDYAKTTGLDRLESLRKSTYSTSTVQTNVTLHRLATMVLEDAGLVPAEVWIDPELLQIVVPFAWFESISHREALRLIAEAALGQVYCDRNGVIRVEGSRWLFGQEAFIMPGFAAMQSTAITDNEALRIDNPTEYSVMANAIEVTTQPLRPAAVAKEVFRSQEPIPVLAGQTVQLTASYTERPVIEAVASLESAPIGATITGANFYAWGVNVSVHSPTAGTVVLLVHGRPLSVTGSEVIIAEDATSIRENGRLRYVFRDNPLVQARVVAQRIADAILRMARHPRRDLALDWRGNPALLPGNIIATQEYGRWNHFYITRHVLEFDGALRSEISGRRAI